MIMRKLASILIATAIEEVPPAKANTNLNTFDSF